MADLDPSEAPLDVEEPEAPAIILACSLDYEFTDESGLRIAGGEAEAQLETEILRVLPRSGEALPFSYREILDLTAGDYRLHLALASGEKLVLSALGYRYEDFHKTLSRLRHAVILQDMLVQEALGFPEVEAECRRLDENGAEIGSGQCQLRLYETSLVIVPISGTPWKIPFSLIPEVRVEDYALVLTTELGERLVLSMLGASFDPFARALSEAMNRLSVKAQSTIQELLPGADPSVIRRVSRLMKDGKAARRADVEAVSPDLWAKLQEKLQAAGLAEEYDFLATLAQADRMCIGVKRGLMGDLTGEYVWFLIPIYSADPLAPGNVVAMEAVSGEAGGRATYFFKMVDRLEYAKGVDLDGLHAAADAFIKRLNHAMLSIDFRREPVSLPEKRLVEPQYAKYIFALRQLPSLRMLRDRFVGRVIHASPQQWQQDVLDLLRFNVTTQSEVEKWRKGG